MAAQAQLQQHIPNLPSAAVRARVQNAHRIFVANIGQSESLSTDTDWSGLAYPELYNALKAWPGVQMLDAPAQADLIFQLKTTERLKPMQFTKNSYEDYVTLYVSVWDPHTQALLWTDHIVARVDTAPFGDIYAKAIQKLLAPLDAGMQLPPLPKKQPPAPYPAAMRAPKKLFLELDKQTPATALNTELETAMRQRLATKYTIVDSPGNADLILELVVKPPNAYVITHEHLSYEWMRLDEFDPTTGYQLWSIKTAFTRSDKTPQLQIAHTMPYFWKKWNHVIGVS